LSSLPLSASGRGEDGLGIRFLASSRAAVVGHLYGRNGNLLEVGPLAQLAETKEKVRSALNRATRKSVRNVATASDDAFLYV
jgi:hypothetical protein